MAILGSMRSAWNKMFGDKEWFFGIRVPEDKSDREEDYDIPAKLMNSVQKNWLDMEPFRKNAQECISQFVGKYGVDDGQSEPWAAYHRRKHVIPVNKMRQMIKIYMRLLASDVPQAFVDTQYEELKPFADTFRLALNRHLKEIHIENATSRAVLDAMFSVGIIKTGLAEGEEEYEVEGEWYDPGKPFSAAININNFVIDLQAQSIEEISFIGDRYKRPTAWVQKMRDKRAEEKLAEKRSDGQMLPEDRISGVQEEKDKNLYAETWCWDIYLPKQGLMCLFVDGSDDPLAVYPWNGPEGGPYTLIGFDWVPGEVLPSAPGPVLEPLHNFINSLVRKLERQADRQKQILTYQRGREEDADAIKKASDGEIVGLLNPDSLAQVSFGGPDAGNHNMTIWADQVFDIHAGGLDVLGGTEAMSETAKQDQMLKDSANAIIDDMRRQVRRAHSDVIGKHGLYLWTDPVREIAVWKEVPGTGVKIQEVFSMEVREGDFLQYNFSITPYSLRETTPQELSSLMLTIWNQLVMPNMQLYMQAGYAPNAIEFTQKIFDLNNVKFNEMFVPVDPNAMQGMQPNASGMVQMPQQPFRQTVNTRVSRPGHTKRGNMNAIMTANAGMKQNGGAGIKYMAQQ